MRGLPAGAWVAQHVAVDTEAEAIQWRERRPALSEARVVALLNERNVRYFVVVSGPFASSAEGRAFLGRLPGKPLNHWIRRATDVQGRLDPAAAGAAG